LKILRFLLFPLAIVYSLVIATKNLLYKYGFKKAFIIPKKSIVVGNLSMGGTGKSPLVAYLTQNLKNDFKINILSRGYGRKTKGFILLNEKSVSQQVGDEPLMYKNKFKNEVEIAVSESRKNGIIELLKINNPDLFILDDAFQHRKVKAGLNILLSDYNSPFFNDYILPMGNLREFCSGKNRADILIFTKCPKELTEYQKNEYIQKSNFHNVYFSSINYGEIISFFNHSFDNVENVLLVTGIANSKPLEEHLSSKFNVTTLNFKDHHNFNANDIITIHKKFDIFANDKKRIITTEKDFIRLFFSSNQKLLVNYPWFYQTITFEIDREDEFLKQINKYVRTI
jgi:tetraacyldisaccharide 4'-kinase